MTSAKSAFGVMLIGVVTDRDLRNRGIATYLVTKLCRQCLQEKVPRVCLFYDNPAAGSIYRKIGFREIGIYCMMKKR
jgi:predicted GNAT family acetyltransferase